MSENSWKKWYPDEWKVLKEMVSWWVKSLERNGTPNIYVVRSTVGSCSVLVNPTYTGWAYCTSPNIGLDQVQTDNVRDIFSLKLRKGGIW